MKRLDRRHFLIAGAALAAGTLPAAASQKRHFNFTSALGGGTSTRSTYGGKRIVPYRTKEKPGTIIVVTRERALYYVLPGGKAIRYGVGVGRRGFTWSGTATIRRKKKWPEWRPPAEMIERELKQYGRRLPDVMAGGPKNPLGARALYLFQGNRDTLYRIHGTNAPQTIGRAVSSGCIRMLNEEIIDLYERVKIGTKVKVI